MAHLLLHYYADNAKKVRCMRPSLAERVSPTRPPRNVAQRRAMLKSRRASAAAGSAAMTAWDRIIWIVLDSVGIGELPDAADYDDVGRNTLGHIAQSRPLSIPNLVQLGLANIAPLKHLPAAPAPIGSYGKGATHSPGKDTTTGHWEMAGVWLPQAFPVYKNGFPADLIAEFERLIGRKIIGTKPASGTEIIKELGG